LALALKVLERGSRTAPADHIVHCAETVRSDRRSQVARVIACAGDRITAARPIKVGAWKRSPITVVARVIGRPGAHRGSTGLFE
jgi:hypothetical protein